MEETKKINLTNQDGTMIQADVLLYFTLKTTGKDYVIYSFNETDQNDMMTIYTSIVTKNGEQLVLSKIQDENEWNQVKDVMRQVIKENNEQ